MHTHLGRRRPGEQKTSGPCYEKTRARYGGGGGGRRGRSGRSARVRPRARLPAVCRTGAGDGPADSRRGGHTAHRTVIDPPEMGHDAE